MTLPTATRLAERIASELWPYCDQLAIAGSIRRRRDWCNDIDLVALPKPGKIEALLHRCKQHASLLQGDKVNFIFQLKNQVQLDLFLAVPEQRDMFSAGPTNYGSLLLCRTGSKEHNIYLIEHAKKMGLKWNPHHGVFGPVGWPVVRELGLGQAKCLASATEEEIFQILALPFISPENRER